jgi:hypothetical protein
MITIIIVVAILIGLALFLRYAEIDPDTDIMRDTIAVNLSILEPELVELKSRVDAILTGGPAPAGVAPEAVAEAKELLDKSESAANSVRDRLGKAKHDELGELLTQLFQAMSQATDARILLKACVPHLPGGFVD